MVGWFGTLDELALKSEATEESPVPRNEVGVGIRKACPGLRAGAGIDLRMGKKRPFYSVSRFARVRL